MVHFDASVISGESPVYGRSGLVSFCLQGRDFATEGLFIGNAPAQDAPPQDAEFDLCHIEPTAVSLALGRVLAFAGKHLGLGIKAVSLALWQVLAFTVKYLGLGIKAVSLALWRVLAFAGKHMGLGIKAGLLAAWRVLAFAGKYLALGFKAVFLALWRFLGFAGKHLWLAISTPLIYLGKGIAWAGKHLGLGIKAVSLALWRVLVFVGKHMGLGISTPLTVTGKDLALVWGHLRAPIATIFGYLRPALLLLLVSPYILASFLAYLLIKALGSQAVALGARQLWRAISVPSILLVRVTAGAWRSTYSAVVSLCQLAGMALAFTIKCLLLAIYIPFIYLGQGIGWIVKSLGSGAFLLLLGLIRALGFAARPLGRAGSSFFQSQAVGLRSLGRYFWAAAYTMGRDLQAGLSLLGRYAAGVLVASPRYARAGLIFGLSNLAVAVGVLAFSPLILLRLAVDKAYRQKMAARSGRLWAFLKVRPALVLPCLAFTAIIGLTPWYVPRLLPSETPLEVLIWTSEEKHVVLQLALDRFNEDSPAITVDGRRYAVQARAVPMPSAVMYDHLVARLDRGTAFPLEFGLPIVVSPSNSNWLGQINLDTGQEIFQLDHLRPIVRTPVVIATHRGTVECLGWPERPFGWADLIALRDNPEVWAACPAAGSDWGTQSPPGFGDPATSSTARSALQALLLVGAEKLAEEFSPEDLEGPSVEELLSLVRAASEPSSPGGGESLADPTLALAPGHFQPVEEYQVAQYYLRLPEAADGPDSEPSSEIVAIYPREGTMWHDNPYGIVNVTWVSPEQREAALLLQQHLRSREEQDRFMEEGFRPGIYLEPREVLTPTRGLNLKQPQTFLGRVSPEVVRAIQGSWEEAISR